MVRARQREGARGVYLPSFSVLASGLTSPRSRSDFRRVASVFYRRGTSFHFVDTPAVWRSRIQLLCPTLCFLFFLPLPAHPICVCVSVSFLMFTHGANLLSCFQEQREIPTPRKRKYPAHRGAISFKSREISGSVRSTLREKPETGVSLSYAWPAGCVVGLSCGDSSRNAKNSVDAPLLDLFGSKTIRPFRPAPLVVPRLLLCRPERHATAGVDGGGGPSLHAARRHGRGAGCVARGAVRLFCLLVSVQQKKNDPCFVSARGPVPPPPPLLLVSRAP